MGSSQTLATLFFFIYVLLTFSNAATDPKPTAIHLPIRKNSTSLQYYTFFVFGSGIPGTVFSANVDPLLDLEAQSVWLDCSSYVSVSYKPIPCGSNPCNKTKGSICAGCNSTPRPGCSNNTCAVPVHNRFQELGEDTMTVTSTDGRVARISYDIPHFRFSCGEASTVEELGLPGVFTKGVAGFARTQGSLPSQISSSAKLANKFALCLPSSSAEGLGDVFIGGGPYYMPPRIEDQSLSFVSTPLVVNPVRTDEYFINVKAIEISGKHVGFDSSLLSLDKNGVGGTKISTVAAYTTLHASIYKRLVKDFTKAAALNYKMKRVKSVAPFGACFDSKTVTKTITGAVVPDIDLVLEGNGVRLRLYGSNSMVEAKENVLCLAFLDGGVEARTSMVLGGHQLEDRLVEFDLGASKLAFTPSLLLLNTSCSHARLS